MKKEKKNLTQNNAAGKSADKKRIFVIAGVVVACLAVIYVGFGIFFQSHFCFGTTIDGIKAGGKSVEKMEQLITEEIDSYVLNLEEREEGQESIAGDSIHIAPVFNGEVEELLNGQNGFAWVVTLFKHENLELAKVVTFDENALDSELQALNCMQAGAQREPVDATVSAYTADGYSLVPADYGTTIDKSAFKKAVEDSILVLADELDLDEADCYVKPKVEDDNEKLLAVIDEMNSYVGTTITYDFDVAKEVLDGERISEWLSVDDDLNLVVDEEGVLSFVKELASKYNTCYKPKELKTSYGSTVTISNGPYGWKINNSEEVAQIVDDLKAGKKVEREPVYSQTANSHGENDYGNSYVEINLTSQHLFVYKDGVLVTESDFVSGNVAKGHTTPGGAFMVTYKTMNAVLRGPDYETPVTYWMPFNGDIGIVASVDIQGRTLQVDFDGHLIEYDASELDELVHAYATTIHKAQGSEYPIVVMPVLMNHYVMLQRNLIYTGITRAKKVLVIVGTRKALSYAVRNVTVTKRNTFLKERLCET